MTSKKVISIPGSQGSTRIPQDIKRKIMMQTTRSSREQISFKQHEAYLQDARDQLCKHYRLNKSDLIKFLIKKESYILKQPQETWTYR